MPRNRRGRDHEETPNPPSEPARPTEDVAYKRLLGWAAVLTAITTLIGTVVAWPRPNILFPPTPISLTPGLSASATPIPYAQIQSLDVIQNGNITTVIPDETIILTAGSSVVFKVNVNTKTNLDDFVFHWEFCHPEQNTTGQGAIEISYIFNAMDTDCIRVKIERGGQYLDTAKFLVSTHKSQP